MTIYRYAAIRAQQADGNDVLSIAARTADILSFAQIERVGREEGGDLRGFQRHLIASHIKEIRDYLARGDALLPNAVIVAFIGGATVKPREGNVVDLEIEVGDDKPGFVVDGQQRLTALSGLNRPDFEVFASILICKDYNQLRQQFVLINNTRPLPKALIYELLPSVEGLPERFSSRSLAAKVVDRLNFAPNSSLRGEIKQHTNPAGVINDIALQKLVMNSSSDGALRELSKYEDFEERAYALVNEFFAAVKLIFGQEWVGLTPKSSRLKHGAGIIAMGYVMELLYSSQGATVADEFVGGLTLLKKFTAWTSGAWHFSEVDIRPWNAVQNTPADIALLASYLVRVLKQDLRRPRIVVNQ